MSFLRNQFKTLCGWLIGIPLLSALKNFEPLLVSTVLCVFYALFYSFLDLAIKHIEQYLQDRKEKKHKLFWRGLI